MRRLDAHPVALPDAVAPGRGGVDAHPGIGFELAQPWHVGEVAVLAESVRVDVREDQRVVARELRGAGEALRRAPIAGQTVEPAGSPYIPPAVQRLVEAGDICPECGKPLKVTRGIEVGNIFQLGTKYSKPMNAVFLDQNGKTQPYVMGCYGIGVTRTAAAAVEAHHDDHGIIWPLAIAPYHVVVIPVSTKDEQQMKVANDIYQTLIKHGVEAVLDDRDERAGVKFKDADLIGFPYRITVGKGIADGVVEFKSRESEELSNIKPEEACEIVVTAVHNIK